MPSIPPSERFGAEVRAHMARQRKTNVQLAELLGCSEGTIYRRFAGRNPWPLDDAMAIAAWLGVPIGELLTLPAAVPA